MVPYTPNKLIATKYCFLILGDNTSFFFFLFRFNVINFMFLCYIIHFYKNYLILQIYIIIIIIVIIIIIIIIYFIHKNYFYFFMFRDFPDIPCSGLYRRPFFFEGFKLRPAHPWQLIERSVIESNRTPIVRMTSNGFGNRA